MDIRPLMSVEVVTCRPDDTTQRAAQLLWEKDLGALPVVDERGKVVGMITDRDICMAAFTRGLPLMKMSVASAMAKNVVSCRVDDALEVAEMLMERHAVRRLPVLDLADDLVGMITLADLARHARIEGHADRDALSARAVTRVMAIITAPACDRRVA